jgi:hypothetical protein
MPYLVLGSFAIMMALTTRFFYFSSGNMGHDASIFATVGNALLNGKVMYTEIWENKGPLLYFINAFALLLDYKHGLFWVELLNLFVTLIFAYKTALIISSNKKSLSVIAAVFSLLILTVTLEGGNLSEEYALPFLTAGLYLCVKYLYNNLSLKVNEKILIGVCCGACFLLRINICALFFIFAVGIAVILIKSKQFKELLSIAGFASVGFAAIILPFYAYLIVNGAFSAYVDAALLTTNAFSELLPITVISNVAEMVFATKDSGVLFIAVVYLIAVPFASYFGVYNDRIAFRRCLWINWFGLIINLFANSVTGAYHLHYFMTFVPFLVIPGIWFAMSVSHIFTKMVRDDKLKKISALVTTAIMLFITLTGFVQTVRQMISFSDYSKTITKSAIVSYVETRTSPNDYVQVIGDVTLNYKTHTLPASKYQYLVGGRYTYAVVKERCEQMASDITAVRPKLIVYSDQGQYDYMLGSVPNRQSFENFLSANYTRVDGVDGNYIAFYIKQ